METRMFRQCAYVLLNVICEISGSETSVCAFHHIYLTRILKIRVYTLPVLYLHIYQVQCFNYFFIGLEVYLRFCRLKSAEAKLIKMPHLTG
jgi:hypothetical protein